MEIKKAERTKSPLMISIAGVSGSGKTFSALLMAAGLAGNGKVGFLDTENGRGDMYADSQIIGAALPQGYFIGGLKAPFSPSRFIDAIESFEKADCQVLIVDSATHEWDGYGGCQDIAENNKLGGAPNWAMAKREHKRLMHRILASNMHIIFCLRAQEKTKVEKIDGKMTFIPMGIQPIQEKNFVYEMTLSLTLEEGTNLPTITKCPEPLRHLFQQQGHLITPAIGKAIAEWNQKAIARKTRDEDDLLAEALAYANEGVASLQEYFQDLPIEEKAVLKPKLEEAKEVARIADQRRNPTETTNPLTGEAL